MTLKIERLTEPDLIFRNDARYVDPKIGLMNYGPCELSRDLPGEIPVIRAGAIGSAWALSHLRWFLARLHTRISAEEGGGPRPWQVDFPGIGVKSPLRFDVLLDEGMVVPISEDEEREAVSPDTIRERIKRVVALYESKFLELDATAASMPRLVFLPISDRVMGKCKDSHLRQQKIVYHRRSMAEESVPADFPILDFHNVLKVIGMEHRLPVQVIRPATLQMEGQSLQDPATIAWNISVAVLYKGTASPWKLADLNEKTCYVGISFFVEVGETSSMRAAMAQVYLKTGESQIIRGKKFLWANAGYRRSPTLTAEQASEILTDVITLYRSKSGVPERVVVHKSSGFTDVEKEGFGQASGSVPLDLVYVMAKSSVRLFHLDSDYPPVRGTFLSSTEKPEGILYTNGFVPALGTYAGSTVPWPLRFRCDQLATDARQVATDLMSLTRLDWNNANFLSAMPVTLSVTGKVGEILSETRARKIIAPPQQYRFYM